MTTGDTIAAFSSVVAPGARIILRVSGPQSHDFAHSICPDFKPNPSSAVRQFLRFADFQFPAWIYTFRSPHSYTGEDLVEFHMPGNPVLAQMLLAELLRRGARLAEAGEFTARAYFAGKLDLTEAEGVAATIAASNEQELQAARQLLAGELARRLKPLMDLIAETLALVEVGIDFSEEDVTFLPVDEIRRRVEEVDNALDTLLDQSTRFERLAHEPRIVLVGRPNAGKSTLINALCGHARSIVSDISGTTRDVLSAPVELPHGRAILVDIAGLDETSDVTDDIARLMREHALRAIESAEHIVLVRDSSDLQPPPAISLAIDLTVWTKSDVAATPASSFSVRGDAGVATTVSAHSGAGMHQLRDALDRIAFGSDSTGVSLALNRRHVAAIEEARSALSRTGDHIGSNSAELIALELRECLDALGWVLGSISPDDLLGKIFSRFCIGK
jgi:tRNA modification GTPase